MDIRLPQACCHAEEPVANDPAVAHPQPVEQRRSVLESIAVAWAKSGDESTSCLVPRFCSRGLTNPGPTAPAKRIRFGRAFAREARNERRSLAQTEIKNASERTGVLERSSVGFVGRAKNRVQDSCRRQQLW